MEPQWLIKAAAYRGRWIDQSQSLNIFYGGTSGKVLSDIYQYAWSLGLKTTYYLRTLGASRIEKSTVNLAKFGGTSKSDSGIGTIGNPAISSIIIEETIAVLPRQPHEEPQMMAAESVRVELTESVESPAALVADVAASIEYNQVRAGQMSMPGSTPRAIPTPVSVPERGSAGVPTFGKEKLAVVDRPFDLAQGKPKIEIIGEACESCSA